MSDSPHWNQRGEHERHKDPYSHYSRSDEQKDKEEHRPRKRMRDSRGDGDRNGGDGNWKGDRRRSQSRHTDRDRHGRTSSRERQQPMNGGHNHNPAGIKGNQHQQPHPQHRPPTSRIHQEKESFPSPPKILILDRVPSHISWQDIKSYTTQTFNVRARFVQLEPSSSTDCNCAYIIMGSHEEAKKVLNWDMRGEYLLNDANVVLVGLHDSNELPKQDRGQRSSSWGRKTEDDASFFLQGQQREAQQQQQQQQQQQHRQEKQQKKQEEWEAQQLKQQQEWEAQQLKQQEEWEAQQAAHQKRLSERHHLQNRIHTSNRQVQLLTQQASTLEQQLTLHNKMLALLSDNSQKATKMKDILSLTKQVHSVKKQRLELMSKVQEDNSNLDVLVLEHKRQVAIERSPARKFRLDNRTRVLQVSGIVASSSTTTDSSKEGQTVLQELKAHLMKFGQVTDLKWHSLPALQAEEKQSKPMILVQCASRSDAEHILKQGGTMGGATLEFTWYHDDFSPRVVVDEKQEGSEGNGCVKTGNGESKQDESKKTLEQNLYYAEDDDLMVDYDEEEEDDEDV